MLCLCVVLTVLVLTDAAIRTLHIGAYNAYIFGADKMEKKYSAHMIANTILRYDLVLVQEIREKEGTGFQMLYDKIVTLDPSYRYILSERLGRSNSKEEYAFMWRSNKVNLKEAYVYTDQKDDFEREPIVGLFHSVEGKFDFIYIGCHTKPSDAIREIDKLYDVSKEAQDWFKVEETIIGGDLNAGCSYLPARNYSDVRLVIDQNYQWLIHSKMDSTSRSTTDCAYDRFIITGNILKSAFNSISIVDLMNDYSMSSSEMLEVSDHFPIGMRLAFESPGESNPDPYDKKNIAKNLLHNNHV